jgi:hypothetical protein
LLLQTESSLLPLIIEERRRSVAILLSRFEDKKRGPREGPLRIITILRGIRKEYALRVWLVGGPLPGKHRRLDSIPKM